MRFLGIVDIYHAVSYNEIRVGVHMAAKQLKFQRPVAPAAASIALAILMAGCGGGGSEGQSEPAPAYEQTRINVAELSGPCDVSCFWGITAFLDEAGEATVFWNERAPGAQPGWQVAVNDPASLSVRSRAFVSGEIDSDLRPLALGGKRFAAVLRDSPYWTSALVDLTVPTAPTVSARVTTPLNYSSELVSGLDGAFAIGPTVPDGEIALGGNTAARGVNLQLPPGYRNLWWGTIVDAVGLTPAAWWAFNAAPDGAGGQRVQVARVDLSTGNTGEVVEVPGWFNPTTYIDQCLPSGPKLAVRAYGRGQVSVGWVNNRAGAARGCDILVDGVVMNGPDMEAAGMPALGGSDAGPIAVWGEYSDTGGTSRSRVMWRHRDVNTGMWSAPAAISNHALAHLNASGTSLTGALAIAWTGCEDFSSDSCASYVSKFHGGAWTTAQFTARGAPVFAPSVAINQNGQVVVAWSDEYNAKCRNHPGKTCPQVWAYRM